jgi:aminobenzoyl-glutamate utilization protein B
MRNRHLALIALLVSSGMTARPVAGQTPDADRLKDEAFASIDARADRLGRMSDAIFSYAEIGFQEVNTIRLVTGVLESAGFRVERGVAKMPTAYRATYGSGSPVIGLMSDFDCVPGASQWPATLTHSPIVEGAPGHGEGHNTHQPVIIGAALAIKELLDKYNLPGTIVVYGGPAEEIVASRGYMVNAGLFDGVDVGMDVHIGSDLGSGYGLNNLANVSVQWTFKGVQGHGASPWTAKSALDAVELMNAGMNYLREHLPLDMRFHYVITVGGKQPNVVPAEATVWYYFRQTNYERLVALWERARLVAEGATLMTGTTVTERVLAGSWPITNNKSLAELVQSNVEKVGMPQWSADDIAFAEAFQRSSERWARRRSPASRRR